MSAPFLSIVIPVHNEEQRLPETLNEVFAYLESQSYAAEVIVVENGSTDRTFQIAQASTSKYNNLHVLRLEERGKGRAVGYGMLQARGEYRFMCDVDFSMRVEELNRFLPPALTDYDIAIASRETPGAVRHGEPYYRHFVGRIFNMLIRVMVLPGLHDTQCGFKCFRAPVADELFKLQTIMGWAFDVEILYIAMQRGYQIVELPIHWYFNPESKIRVMQDSVRMAKDLLTIRLNAARGVYDRNGAAKI